jgi:hypothetical protein
VGVELGEALFVFYLPLPLKSNIMNFTKNEKLFLTVLFVCCLIFSANILINDITFWHGLIVAMDAWLVYSHYNLWRDHDKDQEEENDEDDYEIE